MCHGWEEAGCEGEVDECQEGPDAGENAKVDARGRFRIRVVELVSGCRASLAIVSESCGKGAVYAKLGELNAPSSTMKGSIDRQGGLAAEGIEA